MLLVMCCYYCACKGTGKVLPYSLLSVVPRADPGVQAVSPQVTRSHPLGGRLPLLSARPAFTFPVDERHRPLAGTKLYCLVTEAHACEQLAQGCYLEANRRRFEPATFRIASECSTVKPHRPLCMYIFLNFTVTMVSSHILYVLFVVTSSSGVSKLLRQQYEDPQVTGANRYKYFRRLVVFTYVILQCVKSV